MVRWPRASSPSRWSPPSRSPRAVRCSEFAELLIGVLLPAGALTPAAAIAGGVVMIVLVLGAMCVEHFNLIGDQGFYGLFLAFVMAFGSDNRYSIDRILVGHRSTGA